MDCSHVSGVRHEQKNFAYLSEFHCLRGCLHDSGTTFIPGRDEKLHRVCLGASLIVL